jgi:putative Mn2+ efflux pump MntP
MNIVTILFIALGLAMDAFAAAIANGMVLEENLIPSAFRIALFFGLFQAVMPVLGWLVAFKVHDIISQIDHWIAFVLLVFIGSRMIFDSLRKRLMDRNEMQLGTGLLLMLSIATSIDAFAVGITFAFLDISILIPVCIIGVVTFILSLCGFLIAKNIGRIGGRYVGIIGGLILIGIGIKILMEHLKA